jgi:hypothetical protein
MTLLILPIAKGGLPTVALASLRAHLRLAAHFSATLRWATSAWSQSGGWWTRTSPVGTGSPTGSGMSKDSSKPHERGQQIRPSRLVGIRGSLKAMNS